MEWLKQIRIFVARRKAFVAAAVTLVAVLIGLNTTLFASLGITGPVAPPFEEASLDAVTARLIDVQQGVHFLEGMIVAFLFTNPFTGFVVGFLKEAYDLVQHYRGGTMSRLTVKDGMFDLGFWAIGGVVGFYAVLPARTFFEERKIKKIRDLAGLFRKEK